MELQAATKELFIVYLGGDPAPGRLSEDHEVVAVVATDVAAARRAARAKWGGSSRPHVDAVQALAVVDGYRVQLSPTDDQEAAPIDLTYVPNDE
jgi:Domain of Unknown Function (DUF1543)